MSTSTNANVLVIINYNLNLFYSLSVFLKILEKDKKLIELELKLNYIVKNEY